MNEKPSIFLNIEKQARNIIFKCVLLFYRKSLINKVIIIGRIHGTY